jgi:hypothetical protein
LDTPERASLFIRGKVKEKLGPRLEVNMEESKDLMRQLTPIKIVMLEVA